MMMEVLKLLTAKVKIAFMKEKFFNLFRNPSFKTAIQGSFFCNFLSLLVLLLKWNSLPPQLPLFYSLPWGEAQLGSPSQLLILPTASLFIFGLNSLFASSFLDKEPLISKMLLWIAFLNSLLATITLIKIIFLIS